MKINNINSIFILGLSIILMSCKKYLQVPPPKNQLTSESVFSSDAGAIAAQTSIYANMAAYNNFDISYYAGLSSDEFANFSTDPDYIAIANNALTSSNFPVENIWQVGFNCIYQANSNLEGIAKSSALSDKVSRQLKGEAEFSRAYWYFYMVNLFGNLPWIGTPNYKTNSSIPQSGKDIIYGHIIADLKDAQDLLNSNFTGGDVLTTSTERIRPTKWAAAALLARTYLYTRKYDSAEISATAVLNNTSMFNLLADLNAVFKKNSKETIWALQAGNQLYNTGEGAYFTPYDTTQIPFYIALSTQQMAAFEVNDKRKDIWVGMYNINGTPYYYPFKYKINYSTTVSEYEVVFRLAEQYLIRAEARAQLGNINGAISDINTIRHRAGLADYNGANNKDALLNAILHERQTELFAELGHRWFDLKRTLNVDAIMQVSTPLKGGGNWNSYQQLYPIPVSEILADQNLKQNSGY